MVKDGAVGAQSRRKVAPGPSARKPITRRKLGLQLAAVALVVLLFLVFRTDGGPGQSAGAVAPVPQVESWHIVATGTDGTAMRLCASAGPACDPEAMWGQHVSNSTCVASVHLWLANDDLPFLVHGMEASVKAAAWQGDYGYSNTSAQPINITYVPSEFEVPWTGGWWWRPESEVLPIRLMVPCDAHQLELGVTLSGVSWLGEDWSSVQHARVLFHAVFLEAGARAPASPA